MQRLTDAYHTSRVITTLRNTILRWTSAYHLPVLNNLFLFSGLRGLLNKFLFSGLFGLLYVFLFSGVI